MRLRDTYLNTLIQCGMFGIAVGEAEEMIRLCERDNLGIRSTLMCLYTCFEDVDKAQKLAEKYADGVDCQLTLPLAVLYYKKCDFTRSKKYLRQLLEENPDTREFFRAIINDDMAKHLANASPLGYRYNSIEEYAYTLAANKFLYFNVGPFFEWAHEQLKKMRKYLVSQDIDLHDCTSRTGSWLRASKNLLPCAKRHQRFRSAYLEQVFAMLRLTRAGNRTQMLNRGHIRTRVRLYAVYIMTSSLAPDKSLLACP